MNFLKVLKFDLINIIRNRMLLILSTVFPLVLFGVLGLVYHKNFGNIVNSYDYYAVTTMVLSGMLAAMTTSNTFMEEKVKHGNFRIAYFPLSKASIYMSKLLSTFIFSSISYSFVILIEQYIFNRYLGGKNVIFFILLIIVLNFFGCSLGTMMCCLLKKEEKSNEIITVISMVFLSFGGIFFPVSRFRGILRTLANFTPLKWVTESAFRVIYSYDFTTYFYTMLGLLILSLICIVICQISYKPEDHV